MIHRQVAHMVVGTLKYARVGHTLIVGGSLVAHIVVGIDTKAGLGVGVVEFGVGVDRWEQGSFEQEEELVFCQG